MACSVISVPYFGYQFRSPGLLLLNVTIFNATLHEDRIRLKFSYSKVCDHWCLVFNLYFYAYSICLFVPTVLVGVVLFLCVLDKLVVVLDLNASLSLMHVHSQPLPILHLSQTCCRSFSCRIVSHSYQVVRSRAARRIPSPAAPSSCHATYSWST